MFYINVSKMTTKETILISPCKGLRKKRKKRRRKKKGGKGLPWRSSG